METTENRLKAIAFFQSVKEETLSRLIQEGRIRKFPKGHALIRAGEEVSTLYFQLSGKSFVYTLTHSGQRKIHFILGKGALLNQNTLNHSVASTYCELLEPGMIFCVPAEVFARCMQSDFALTRALLGAQEHKIWRLEHQMKNTISSLYMERKLAAKLWKLARDFGMEKPEGIEIDVNFSVHFLADMLGVPRETASRLRNALVKYGLIQVNRKRITVTNPDGLAHFYKTGEINGKNS